MGEAFHLIVGDGEKYAAARRFRKYSYGEKCPNSFFVSYYLSLWYETVSGEIIFFDNAL